MHDDEINGLDAKELAALTRVECGKGLPVDTVDCPVCFATLAEVPATILPCSHAFCEDCTVRWMATHTTCPMCRLDCRFVNGFAPFKPRRQRAVPTGQIAPLAAPTTPSAAPASGLAAPLVSGVGAAPVLADVASPETTTVFELAPPPTESGTPVANNAGDDLDCRLSSPRIATPRGMATGRTPTRAAAAASLPLSSRTSSRTPRAIAVTPPRLGDASTAAGASASAGAGEADGPMPPVSPLLLASSGGIASSSRATRSPRSLAARSSRSPHSQHIHSTFTPRSSHSPHAPGAPGTAGAPPRSPQPPSPILPSSPLSPPFLRHSAASPRAGPSPATPPTSALAASLITSPASPASTLVPASRTLPSRLAAALAASVDAERIPSFASGSAAGSISTPPRFDAEPAAAPAVTVAAGSGDRGRSLAAAADNELSARRLLSGAEPSPRTRPGASNLRPPPSSTAARGMLPSPSPSPRPLPHHTTTRPRLTGQATSAVSSPRGQRVQ